MSRRRPPPYAGAVIATALRTAWEEPRVEPPPGRPWWDWAIVAVLVPVTLLEGALTPDVPWRALTTALALVCVLALLWRRSHPLAALVVAFGAQTVAGVGPNLTGVDDHVLLTTSCVLLLPYSLTRWASGRHAVCGLAFLLTAHFVREPILEETAQTIVVGAGFLLFPAALGASVRFQRRSRSRELEQVRMREREDLARELHDTVAHHVSGILIQAQAGRTVAGADPERAVEVLGTIEGAAGRALAEMRSLVGILRADDQEAELSPVGGVADLDRLVRDLEAQAAPGAGDPTVALLVDPELGRLEPTVDAAVYRIVQEAITNARRHARGASRIEARVAGAAGAPPEPDGADGAQARDERDGSVRVEVVDDGRGDGPTTTGPGPGYGLVGMAERVELLGGAFAAGPRPGGGGWQVLAVLPRTPPPASPTTERTAGAAGSAGATRSAP